ncbi:hypothetical protein PUR43_01890, partial [Enterobacter hormaechei subsp. xiangfangensis]|nr:hypothetical protein [Enterobacter hormaechei subsp. xiangfangensis]
MNFIATVNTPAHGHISVTFSDDEKSVLGAWRDNVGVFSLRGTGWSFKATSMCGL